MYKIVRDRESSDELVLKYFKEVRGILDVRLKNLTNKYQVPEKEVKGIESLIKKLICAHELKDKCEDITN